MPKFKSLQVGIKKANPSGSSFVLDLSEAKCNWTNNNDGTAELNLSIKISSVEQNSPIELELTDVPKLSEKIGVIVLDKNDSSKIPIAVTENFMKFETDMSKSKLTISFMFAGKAGGTTGGNKAGGTTGGNKAGGTTGGEKAGGTTEANFID